MSDTCHVHLQSPGKRGQCSRALSEQVWGTGRLIPQAPASCVCCLTLGQVPGGHRTLPSLAQPRLQAPVPRGSISLCSLVPRPDLNLDLWQSALPPCYQAGLNGPLNSASLHLLHPCRERVAAAAVPPAAGTGFSRLGALCTEAEMLYWASPGPLSRQPSTFALLFLKPASQLLSGNLGINNEATWGHKIPSHLPPKYKDTA